MERKVFFFDIDGTILSEITGEVPASAVFALEELRKQGHLTFINTGRMYSSVPDVITTLPVTGYVCGCGTEIIYEGETLFLKQIPEERFREIADVVWKCNGDIVLEGVKDCYFSKKKSRFDKMEYLKRAFNELDMGITCYIEDKDCECSKYCFFADEESDMEGIMKNLSVDMDVMDRGHGFYEVSPIPCSKASGIDFIMKHFGLDKEDAFVFGDSSNDLSMFSVVEHAIAMGKHDPILEPYTEFVTKTVEEDGIFYALQHYGFLY